MFVISESCMLIFRIEDGSVLYDVKMDGKGIFKLLFNFWYI